MRFCLCSSAVCCPTRSPWNVYKYTQVSFERWSFFAFIQSTARQPFVDLTATAVVYSGCRSKTTSISKLSSCDIHTATPQNYCWNLHLSLLINARNASNTYSATKYMNGAIWNCEYFSCSVEGINVLRLLSLHRRTKARKIIIEIFPWTK